MIKRCKVLSIMVIYLLVVLAHIFYLPRITPATTQTTNSIFKRKLEKAQSLNCFERTAKATFKETIKSLVAETPLAYLDILFAEPQIKNQDANFFLSDSRSHYNHRYSYLSYCTFRV